MKTPRFTLVELAVVVAIVAVLAAIAVPLMANYLAKSRRSEAAINSDAIAQAGLSYAQQGTSYATGGDAYPFPRAWADLDKNTAPWTEPNVFDELGFRADGAVRCTYAGTADSDAATGFTQGGGWSICDVDNDNRVYYFKRTWGDQGGWQGRCADFVGSNNCDLAVAGCDCF